MIMVALALAVLALLGFVSSYTIGWLAHILLIVAISLALTRAIHAWLHATQHRGSRGRTRLVQRALIPFGW